MGAGEGAIVVCGNLEQANLLRTWSNFGFSLDRTAELQGTNAKMPEVSAAYGLYSLVNLDREKSEWLTSQQYVASQTGNCPWTTFANSQPQFHPYWIASFKDEKEKNVIGLKLEQAGIQCREWWAKPLSLQKAFSKSRTLTANDNASFLSAVHLGLPMYRGLTSDTVNFIREVIETELQK